MISKQFKIPGSTTMNCPGCRKELEIRLHAQSRCVVCPACFRAYDPLSHAMIREFSDPGYVNQVLPVGSKGTLNNIEYTVTGYLLNKEHGEDYYWSEYILFNYIHGYAYLSEFNGHWTFLQDTARFPRAKKLYASFIFDGIEYSKFMDYKADVAFAAGEFPYRVDEPEAYRLVEYISPPYMLTRCSSADEISWLKGESIEGHEIESRFSNTGSMPSKKGVGALQVQGFKENYTNLRNVFFAFAGILLLALTIFNINCENTLVSQYSGVCGTPNDSGRTFMAPHFTLDKSSQNLEFEITTDVSNGWIDCDVTLVNEQTGKEYHFAKGVEYYFGHDDEGNWTEGDRKESVFLSAVPEGRYHMSASAMNSPGSVNYYSINVYKDVPVWRNFFIVLILAAIWPAIQYIRVRNFEFNRWINSNVTN